jgi:heme A synthase
MKSKRFAWFAWGVLVYNQLVILWGAFVRATGSGAGCGSHWPLCNGEVIPRSPQLETMIEFVHRLSSGFSLLLILALFIWAFRVFPKGSPVRLGASLSVVFILTEALVGAGLVLFEWVAGDASSGRVISMAIHLINTFLLLASLTMTGWWASGGESLNFQYQGAWAWFFAFGFMGIILLGVSGAITALGDTLFPAATLSEGLAQDFNPAAHFLLRLRLWHPVIAVILGFYLLFLSGLVALFRPVRSIRVFAACLAGLFVLQLGAGITNLLLLAPVWMQLIHLLLADLVWITLVLLAMTNFSLSEISQNAEPTRSLLPA